MATTNSPSVSDPASFASDWHQGVAKGSVWSQDNIVAPAGNLLSDAKGEAAKGPKGVLNDVTDEGKKLADDTKEKAKGIGAKAGDFFQNLMKDGGGIAGGIIGIIFGWLIGTVFGGPLSWIVMGLAIPGLAFLGATQLGPVIDGWFGGHSSSSPSQQATAAGSSNPTQPGSPQNQAQNIQNALQNQRRHRGFLPGVGDGADSTGPDGAPPCAGGPNCGSSLEYYEGPVFVSGRVYISHGGGGGYQHHGGGGRRGHH